MDFGGLLWLSIGVAFDAMAVAAARGAIAPRVLPVHALKIALWFGGFQAALPVLGWFLGRSLGPLVEAWDHWLAFALLVGLGLKLLWESRRASVSGGSPASDPFDTRILFALALATSIDAFAVGVMLPMLEAPFWTAIATIGVTTAVLCVIGLYVGHRFGAALGRRLDFAGGCVLIALGVKILVEHLGAS
jgi:putative Mn2+ efflux pump MntP